MDARLCVGYSFGRLLSLAARRTPALLAGYAPCRDLQHDVQAPREAERRSIKYSSENEGR